MKPQRWTAADLAEKGYAEVLGKWGKNGSAGRSLQVKSKRVVPYGASAAPSLFRSKLEAAFATVLELEKRTGLIKDYFYEPFSFKLANGKRYRADFLRWNLDGTTDCLEIKGYHANLRDSLTHLAWAAQKFPFHRWLLVTRTKDGWEEVPR